MKKILSVLTAAALLFGMLGISSFAAEADEAQSAEVYVTIANAGDLVVKQQKITVTDTDNDGYLTINDALYLAHEASYEGGAAAGYGSADSGWGLGITVLWGDKSGNFGYYVNNAAANSLADIVKNGDYITAFVYKNADFSDVYSAFDSNTSSVKENESITLTLSYYYYDMENGWALTAAPVADATVTVNGEATSYRTDADGKVTFSLPSAGSYVISATSDTKTLVPPVCTVSVSALADDTDDKNYTPIIVTAVAAVAVVAVAATYIVLKRKKK